MYTCCSLNLCVFMPSTFFIIEQPKTFMKEINYIFMYNMHVHINTACVLYAYIHSLPYNYIMCVKYI